MRPLSRFFVFFPVRPPTPLRVEAAATDPPRILLPLFQTSDLVGGIPALLPLPRIWVGTSFGECLSKKVFFLVGQWWNFTSVSFLFQASPQQIPRRFPRACASCGQAQPCGPGGAGSLAGVVLVLVLMSPPFVSRDRYPRPKVFFRAGGRLWIQWSTPLSPPP